MKLREMKKDVINIEWLDKLTWLLYSRDESHWLQKLEDQYNTDDVILDAIFGYTYTYDYNCIIIEGLYRIFCIINRNEYDGSTYVSKVTKTTNIISISYNKETDSELEKFYIKKYKEILIKEHDKNITKSKHIKLLDDIIKNELFLIKDIL